MIVRAMRPEDFAAVAELAGGLGYATTTAQARQRFDVISQKGCGRLLVAESEDGKVIGWIHIFGAYLMESDAHAEIAGLVVSEHARGQGVGRALVEAAEDWASEQGFRTVRVRSNVVRERTQKFYEQIGYDHIKTQNNFRKVIG